MATPPSGRQIRLAAHDQQLVAVEVGGGIRSYTAGGLDVVDGYSEAEMCAGGRGQLLAPWPNRLADGTFEWEGQDLQLPLNQVDEHNAIHGLVRWASWAVESATADHTRLVHRLHPQPGWPWLLDLAVDYRLLSGGLVVTTTVSRPRGGPGGPCPFGFGWHPYLYAGGEQVDGVRLTLPASTAYRSDERGLPAGRYPVSGTDVDFRRGRRIGAAVLDIAFTDIEQGADGRAEIIVEPSGSRPVRMWADGSFSHFMVFTGDTLAEPARRRMGLAVEPMTGAPNLLRTGDGLRALRPGESFEASWGIDPFGYG